ncbi:uncharacterized protein LOC122725467 isoform X2 [Dromiciops gliroides]|uniref:uncharacterized protein LOC122725467 isoform X2 n=1 Tax=Dromiciops gliroides TaxID=33562 RepID=UPI001CC65C21|nr:uncharacterized protein LOC122725467 isoform X2 [Dromiciops gliroides]
MINFRGQRVNQQQYLFLWFLLCAFSHITGNCISEVGSSLTRTQGNDVLFRLDRKIGNETRQIRWYSESKKLLLLTTYPGKSSQSQIIPQKAYEGRLSAPDDNSLKLINLTSEDSGCYKTEVTSVLGETHTQQFNLTVIGTVSTVSNMNLWIWTVIVPGSLAVLILVAYCLRKRWNCYKTQATPGNDRGRNMPPVPNHMEDRRLEEGCALVQMVSLQIKKHSPRAHGDI